MTSAQSFEVMGFESLPKNHDVSTRERIDELKGLENKLLKRGEKLPEAQMPDISLERQELQESSESIWSKFGKSIEKAFEFLVVKPANYVWEKIKDHPMKTIMLACAAFAMWYFSAPLSAGISGIKEAGMKLTKNLFGKAISIDPTQINVIDDLFPQTETGVSQL